MLNMLRETLINRKSKKIYIPDLWNITDLPVLKQVGKEYLVDENEYLIALIDQIQKQDADYKKNLSSITKEETWLKDTVAYSMMVRASTTWDYNHDGKITPSETGTFIRTLFLLPYLKYMGVNLLYLLPISKYSLKNRKGELGSVYGVQNFFEFDPNLKHATDLTIEEEFQVLVEAAHMMGIRVMIDIIPRTNSVNSDLVQEHPDWFYWIKANELKKYSSPFIDTIEGMTQPFPEFLEQIYTAKSTKAHLKRFVENPSKHPDWDKYKHDLALVKKHLGVIVAPAFSDHVNDTQPPWTDVTFFRLYMDAPVEAQEFISKDQAPYILFDTIKGNLYQGKVVNQGLWDILSGVIPFYQKFGIDGARIDMGHALPKELTELIISRAKEQDPNFAFVAEELNANRADLAKDLGYDMIIGDGFWRTPRYEEGKTEEFYFETRYQSIPSFASSETHDTKRVAARDFGGKKLSKLVSILNMFAPNTVPFINSGQELFELQPMNLGIDCVPEDQFTLPSDDAFYGKLALFDKYQFHYTVEDRFVLPNLLHKIKEFKEQFPWLLTYGTFVPLRFDGIIGFEYFTDHHKFQILANFDLESEKELTSGVIHFYSETEKHILAPGEVKIIQLY